MTEGVAQLSATSANHKSRQQRRIVRGATYHHLIFALRQIPDVLFFVEGLKNTVVDRNGDRLRFARSKRYSLPPDKPLEGLV